MVGRVIIVGAGQAGSTCAAKLRTLGHEGQITLLGAEPFPPYQRPPLSKKYLMGEMALERLFLRPESFYQEQGIELRLGCDVVGIDRASKTVATASGPLDYDALVLTTGAVPRMLPESVGGELEGVYVMRTLADADALAPEFAPGRRALVVGGGYIGLEAAAVAASQGIEVTLIELSPRILQRVAAPETADFFRNLHQHHGVRILENVGLERLSGNEGRVSGARLTDGGQLTVDFAVIGIGVSPNVRLAQAAGLDIDNGIVVDEVGRTSDPNIYAAGDCASFPYRGHRIRLESVQNAIDQAEHVASSLMGAKIPYDPVPWFWSDQYDCSLQIAGLNAGYDSVVTRPGHREGGHSVWYFSADRFLAVDAMNDPKAYMQGKRWLEAGQNPDRSRIGDPNAALRQLV